jgi:hypothetical protein
LRPDLARVPDVLVAARRARTGAAAVTSSRASTVPAATLDAAATAASRIRSLGTLPVSATRPFETFTTTRDASR